MRLLANENFPLDAVNALREAGHDVAWIREDSRGTSDDKILLRAQEENRIVITFQSGIILFRVTPKSSQYIAQAAVQALASRDNWAGHFFVVEDNRIRMKSLTEE